MMFGSRLLEGKPESNTSLEQLVIEEGAPSSSRNSFPHLRGKHEDSDEDVFTVPDMEGAKSKSVRLHTTATSATNPHLQAAFHGKRRRGRNPADKENRRLKRLLRNRVSAQQARERKKVYVNDLESRAKELEDKNTKLEERISTLINENTMLRKVLMNTRPKVDESNEA